MPSPATDAEPAPAPALEAMSEVQEEEEQAEEFTVTEEGTEIVEAGRDALGNSEEEESEAAAEAALEDSDFQADIEADSTEAEVSSALAIPPQASAPSSNSFANCCGLM